MVALLASHSLVTVCKAEESKTSDSSATKDKIMSAFEAMDATAIGGTTSSDAPAIKPRQAADGQQAKAGGIKNYIAKMFSSKPQAKKAAANGNVRQAATGSGTGATDSSGFLPFCDPTNNVICSNEPELEFLDARPDPIVFDGTPYVELNANAGVRILRQQVGRCCTMAQCSLCPCK